MDHFLNQMNFQLRGPSRIASVNLERAQESLVTRKNRTAPKHFQAHLQGALRDVAKMIRVRSRQRHNRNYIADANIYHHAQFVQDPRKRRAQGYQFQNLSFSYELAAPRVVELPVKPKLAWRTLRT